jgi:hypothetical protein
MSNLRKLEILLTSGYSDHLTDVSSVKQADGWMYCFLPENLKVSYRTDRVVRVKSFPQPDE